MVHPQIEPDDQVLLLQTLSVKEVVEIHRWVVHILTVIRVSTLWFSVFAFCDLNIVFRPTRRIDQITTILHSQVCQARIRQDYNVLACPLVLF